jgi:hypothetical protein
MLDAAPAVPAVHPVMAFLDRSILRERRLEALWKRAARGTFTDEIKEEFRFEAYEDREHARILRRHRSTVAKALGVERRAPGSRATKVGRTFTPQDAIGEALYLKAQSKADYASFFPYIQDRYLRKFVEVLAGAEASALVHLTERATALGVRPVAPGARRPSAFVRPAAKVAVPMPLPAPTSVGHSLALVS